ncbi:SDR family NAD(P)-dependent oxidoreductase [Devosia naphthalenivorans]|uniref:SDR family NAD(P)-dependent oxidoreductase n=1 Tax=Devosia naphthalenivorans TaxID=2082392 RepID=UPI000D3C07C2|nr:SDR family NAD(P)-dependent oxidoreductase [Devosia naphthalenivorans]
MTDHENIVEKLAGKTAVVTGASRGIGRAIAADIARQGASLLLVARDEARLAAVADQIKNDTGTLPAILAVDLRETSAGETVKQALAAAYGACDILVNCAGATKGGIWPVQSDDDWTDGFALKFFGTVRVTRILWPLLTQSHGVVVNVVGGFARTPSADFMVGGTVNAALANFSKALAAQGLRDDVNVNWVHPGLIETERYEEISARRAAQTGISVEDVKRQQLQTDGTRRLGRAEDVSNTVTFLCLPESRHIHGTAITIDGGASKSVF